jgi:GH15 family glucan-1,4-alpha-glucosidase
MKQAMFFHLYDDGLKRFVKKIKRQGGKTVERDGTPDASLAAIWILGILPPDDPRIVSTMQQLEQSLAVKTSVGGLARYPIDYYHAAAPLGQEIPGNPWIITTLWLAQWKIAMAKTKADLEAPRATLEWVLKYATPSGLLAEQLHPLTGAHLSVSPLIWSHATYIDTILKFVEKERSL